MARTSAFSLAAFLRFLTVCLIAWTPFAQAALERWEQLGPPEGYIRGMATLKVNSASVGVDTLYVATIGGGVVKSTWSGSTWSTFVSDSSGLGNLNVFSLAFDGTNKILYVATDRGVWQAGVPTSNATALAWSQLTTTGLGCQFTFSVFVPQAGHVLAGTRCSGASSGVYHYTAGTWNRPGGAPPTAGSLGSTSGIQVYSYTPVVGTTCTPACVYANTSAGVFFTSDYTNGASTWAGLSVQPTGADGQSNVFSSRSFTNAGTLYIASGTPGGGVLRNTLPNTGTSDFTTVAGPWVSGPNDNQPGALASRNVSGGLNPDFALDVTTGEFFVSVQGGGSWKSNNGVNTGNLTFSYLPGTDSLPQPRFVVRAKPDPISAAQDSTAMLIIGTAEGIFYGWQGAWQWNRIDFESNGVRTVTGVVPDVIVDPLDSSISYVATTAAVYLVKDRSGQKPQKFELPGIGEIGAAGTKHRLAIDKGNFGFDTIYIGTVGSVVRAGCDSGGCFSQGPANGSSYPGGPNSLPSLATVTPGLIVDPNSTAPSKPLYMFSDRRYPGETIGRGVWKSTDNGNNWTDFSGALGTIGGTFISQKHIFSAAITADGTLFVATRGGLFKSPTSSASWTAVSSPLPGDTGTASIMSDVTADGNNVYVAFYTQDGTGAAGPSTGLYTGNSTTCCTKNGTFPAGIKPATLAITHPGGASTPTIWVGATDDATGGIYRSNDGGTTWQTPNIKLTNKNIMAFGVARSSGQPVGIGAATTVGGGIYLRSVQNGPDFDNDGFADISWRKADGNNSVWLMKGIAIQTAALTNSIGDVNWVVAARGDFDGDGRSDILWRNGTTGDNAIWFMNGTGVASSSLLGNVPSGWNIVGVGDFNGDGKSDILWRFSDGTNAVWFMDGGTLTSSSLINGVPTTWSVAGVGDFNNDGKSDILWRDGGTGDNAVWLMNGATLTSSVLTNNVPTAWTVSGIGDFDSDGSSDVLWHNTSTGDNAMWLMSGTSIKGSALISSVPDLNWSIAAVGDYNADFVSDILWRNGATGANYIWTMSGFNIQSVCGNMGCESGYLPGVPDLTWSVSKQ